MYIIHYGELALKGDNRKFFERKLVNNIQLKLQKIGDYKLQKRYGKYTLDTDDEKVEEVFLSTPGIAYFAKSKRAELNIESMKKVLDSFFPSDFRSFRITTSRTNKSFNIKSMEISRELGAYIFHKYEKKVDLHNPEITFYVNVAEIETYIYCEKIRGIGGLPIWSSWKVVSLLSGGIDSPVASYLMMKRGCQVHLVHAYAKSMNPEKVKEKVQKLSQLLARFQWKIRLYMIPYEAIQREIVQWVDQKYRMLLFKRSIVRLANRLARKLGARAVVMWDAVGQVASQTLENIQCIYDTSNLPVLSPLITYDKLEIIELSKKIWSYETSIEKADDCCSLITGDKPWTKWKIPVLEQLEEDIMISIVEDKVFGEIERIDFYN